MSDLEQRIAAARQAKSTLDDLQRKAADLPKLEREAPTRAGLVYGRQIPIFSEIPIFSDFWTKGGA